MAKLNISNSTSNATASAAGNTPSASAQLVHMFCLHHTFYSKVCFEAYVEKCTGGLGSRQWVNPDHFLAGCQLPYLKHSRFLLSNGHIVSNLVFKNSLCLYFVFFV